MLREDLVKRVEGNLGRNDLTDRMNDFINDGLELIRTDRVFSIYNTTSIITVGQGKRIVSLPSDLQQLFSIQLGNGSYQMLASISRQVYDMNFPEAFITPELGEPAYFCKWGKAFELYPVPNMDYTLIIHYAKKPDPVTSDTTIIHFDYPNLLVAATTLKAVTYLGLYEDCTQWNAIYRSELGRAIVADDRESYHRTPNYGSVSTINDIPSRNKVELRRR